MAQISDLKTRYCVAWETEMEPGNSPESPSFYFENFYWKLGLSSSPRARGFGHNVCPSHKLTLHVTPNVPQDKRFRVTTLLEKQGGNDMPHICSVQTVINSNQVLWDILQDQLSRYVHGYSSGSRVRFVCILECNLQSPIVPHSSKGTIPSSRQPGWFDLPPNLESLSVDLGKLLEDQVLPDVKLKCEERTLPAHRAVLAARSEVFAAMFRNKMAESETGVVDVTDLDARVLELFLGYVYTGKIEDVSEDLVPSLYAAGDKYAVHCLKRTCSDRMVAGLTADNCVGFLAVADAHGDATFKDAVVSFICDHEAVLQSEVWMSFSEAHMKVANEVYQSFVRAKASARHDSRQIMQFRSHRVTTTDDEWLKELDFH